MDNPVGLVGLALVTIFFVIPLVRGIVQAVSERNAWAPFERRDGRHGVLVPGPSFAPLRAPRVGRTTRGLLARWAFWAALTLVFVGGLVYNTFLR